MTDQLESPLTLSRMAKYDKEQKDFEERRKNIKKNILADQFKNDAELGKSLSYWQYDFYTEHGRNPSMKEKMAAREAFTVNGPYIPKEPQNAELANANAANSTPIVSASDYQYPGDATSPQMPSTTASGNKESSKDMTQTVTETSTYSKPKMHVIRNSVDPVYIPTDTAARGGWEKLFFGQEGPAAEANKANVINAQLYGQYAQLNSPNVQIEQPVLQSRTSSTISNALTQQQEALDKDNKFKHIGEPVVRGVGNSQTHSVGYNHLNEPLLYVDDQKITLDANQWAEVKKRVSYDESYGKQLKIGTNDLIKVQELDDGKGAIVKYNPGRIIADQKWINYTNDLTDAMNTVIKQGFTPASNSGNPLTGAVNKSNQVTK